MHGRQGERQSAREGAPESKDKCVRASLSAVAAAGGASRDLRQASTICFPAATARPTAGSSNPDDPDRATFGDGTRQSMIAEHMLSCTGLGHLAREDIKTKNRTTCHYLRAVTDN